MEDLDEAARFMIEVGEGIRKRKTEFSGQGGVCTDQRSFTAAWNTSRRLERRVKRRKLPGKIRVSAGFRQQM